LRGSDKAKDFKQAGLKITTLVSEGSDGLTALYVSVNLLPILPPCNFARYEEPLANAEF
jgi:hypothetical protein